MLGPELLSRKNAFGMAARTVGLLVGSVLNLPFQGCSCRLCRGSMNGNYFRHPRSDFPDASWVMARPRRVGC